MFLKNKLNVKTMINVVPKILYMLVFACGIILVFTGVLKPELEDLKIINKFISVEIIEFFHFWGSILGIVVLVLAFGIKRKIQQAYYISVVLLIFGIISLVIKGLYYKESIFLMVTLLILLPSKKYFYKDMNIIDENFKVNWLIVILSIIIVSIFLGVHVYNNELYSQATTNIPVLNKGYSRFLRASIGIGTLYFIFLFIRIFETAIIVKNVNTKEEIEKIKKCLLLSNRADGALVLINDKKIIFNEKEDAFIMYAQSRKSYIALGDPVGNKEAFSEVILKYYEFCKSQKKQCVFYEISNKYINHYLEAGLNFLKIGEEGTLDIEKFELNGAEKKNLRATYNKLSKEEFQFEIILRDDFNKYKERFRYISDEWLLSKHSGEKGFSLGRFDEEYLKNFNFAVIKKDGEILAFANLFETENKEELSIDLMRYTEDSPSNIMEFLFIKIIFWAKENGYKNFSLGMAPLSGISDREFAPTWNKIGALLYKHGGNFYNFEGLRFFKNKFKPKWAPKYIAFSGVFSLPYILKDVALLISGGVKKLIMK